MRQNGNDVNNIWKYPKISYNIVKCKGIKCYEKRVSLKAQSLYHNTLGVERIC